MKYSFSIAGWTLGMLCDIYMACMLTLKLWPISDFHTFFFVIVDSSDIHDLYTLFLYNLHTALTQTLLLFSLDQSTCFFLHHNFVKFLYELFNASQLHV